MVIIDELCDFRTTGVVSMHMHICTRFTSGIHGLYKITLLTENNTILYCKDRQHKGILGTQDVFGLLFVNISSHHVIVQEPLSQLYQVLFPINFHGSIF